MSFRAHLLLTRPLCQSQRFADLCRKRFGTDLNVTISPLMQIDIVAQDIDVARYESFLFTSENAARAAARLWPGQRPHAFTVGDRTAQTARQAGYKATPCGGTVAKMIDHLAALAPNGPLLHLRGRHSRGALAQNLSLAGVETDEAIIYEQNAKQLSEMAKNLLCGELPVLLPLFSPRTATIFFEGCTDIAPNIEAIVMSKAVAKSCKMQKDKIHIASRPDASAMMDCIDTVLRDL